MIYYISAACCAASDQFPVQDGVKCIQGYSVLHMRLDIQQQRQQQADAMKPTYHLSARPLTSVLDVHTPYFPWPAAIAQGDMLARVTNGCQQVLDAWLPWMHGCLG